MVQRLPARPYAGGWHCKANLGQLSATQTSPRTGERKLSDLAPHLRGGGRQRVFTITSLSSINWPYASNRFCSWYVLATC